MKYKIRKFENGGAVSLQDDDIIDPDETMFDPETGEPMAGGNGSSDDDPGKGGDPAKKTDNTDDDDDHLEGKKGPTDDDDPGNTDDDPKEGEKDKEEEPLNHADFVLKSLGYQTSKVDLGEGNIKDVSELTHEEQLDVITGRFEELAGFYEGKISELQEGNGGFANEIEKTLIDTLRGSEYNLADLAKVITENDPSAVARTASNEDLVTGHLKSLYPDFTDEDIQEELESMQGTSRFERLSSKLREQKAKEPMGEGVLAKAIQSFKQTHDGKIKTAFESDLKGVNDYVSKVDKFGEIPVNDEVRNFILSDIVSDSPEKDSALVESLNSPERLFRLSFLDKFHEQILENTAKSYFEMGKAEADKITGKFKDTPDVITTGRRFKTKSTQGQKGSGNKTKEEEF